MKTVCFDFDGVIHSYVSGWVSDGVILDPVVPGIADVIKELRADGYKVVVCSARAAVYEGKRAIAMYLAMNDIQVDEVTHIKPPALVYVDDRAITFDGKTEGLVDKIKSFVVWQKKEK